MHDYISRVIDTTKLLYIALLLLLSPLAFAGTYYSDVSNVACSDTIADGSNAKNNPWCHVPGMNSWTGTHTPVAGDNLVTRCGTTYTSADLGLYFHWNGAAGNAITVGCSDTTWYVPQTGTGTVTTHGSVVDWQTGMPFMGAWAGTNITINGNVYTIASVNNAHQLVTSATIGVNTSPVAFSYTGVTRTKLDCGAVSLCGANTFAQSGSYDIIYTYASYVTFTNLEGTGQYRGNDGTTHVFVHSAAQGVNGANIIRQHLWYHGWTHDPSAASGIIEMTSQGDNGSIGGANGCNLLDSVCDGSDTAKDDVSCINGSDDIEDGNVSQYAVGTQNAAANQVSNNIWRHVVTSFAGGGAHCDMQQHRGPSSGHTVMQLYGNIVYDDSGCPGVTIFGVNQLSACGASCVSYIHDNLIYDVGAGQSTVIEPGGHANSSGYGTFYVYNNTVACLATFNCYLATSGFSSSPTTVYLANNHIISPVVSPFCATNTGTSCSLITNNIAQTPAVANQNLTPAFDQYSDSQVYPDSPVAVTNSTVAVGLTKTQLDADGFNTASPSYSIGTAMGLTPVQRPASAAWDAGAYQFNGVTTYTVGVTLAGAGTGSVSSSPAGISCGATCSASFNSGTSIVLTESVAGANAFTLWGGATCSEGNQTSSTCSFTLSADTTVTATFVPTYTLTVTLAGAGAGSVSSSPAGISCGATCTASFNSGVSMVLTETPGGGSSFTSWSGATCLEGNQTSATCTFTLTGNTTVPATFAVVTLPTISLSADTAYCNPVNGCSPTYTVTVANCNVASCVWAITDYPSGAAITDANTGLPASCTYGVANALCGDGLHPSGTFVIKRKITDFSKGNSASAISSVVIPPNASVQSSVVITGFGARIAAGPSWLQ